MARVTDPAARAIGAIADRMLKDMPDHAVAKSLQAEVNRLRRGAEALVGVSASRSPLDTPEAHALKVAKAAKRFGEEATTGLNRSIELMRNGIREIERRKSEKVDLVPNEFAPEIRARFFGMNAEDRSDFIKSLVDNNSGPILAAIVKAPPELTGINEAQRAAYEKSILSKHAAAELDEERGLGEVFDAVTAAQRTVSGMVKKLTDPQQIAEIERGASAATAAREAFDQSLQ